MLVPSVVNGVKVELESAAKFARFWGNPFCLLHTKTSGDPISAVSEQSSSDER